MKPERPEDDVGEPLWLSLLIHAHAELSRKLSRIVTISIILSIVTMGGMALHMRHRGNTYLLLVGLLLGLWLGALSAGILWVFMRPSTDRNLPSVGPPGPVALHTGLITAPRLFIADVLRWRDMTSTIMGKRRYAEVRKYLRKDRTHVAAHLTVALIFYVCSSAALLILMWTAV